MDGVVLDLDAVFAAHQRTVYVFVLRMVGKAPLAEDLTQETFLRAYRRAVTYRGEASPVTWLLAIARRVVASYYRSHESTTVPLEAVNEVEDGSVDMTTRLAIEDTLVALPTSAREILVLCDVLELPRPEAAEILGVTTSTLRVRLHRARAAFREVYPDDG